MQGVMAKRYGELIHELWSGNAKSITPLKFRVSWKRVVSVTYSVIILHLLALIFQLVKDTSVLLMCLQTTDSL